MKFDEDIPNPIVITFNPLDIQDDENRLVKKVFVDDIARTLWLGIRSRHITDQYFHQKCLNLADKIRKDGVPNSDEDLKSLLHRYIGYGYASLEFSGKLLPYIKGENKLEYKVIETEDN
nr:hypothetical protein [Candidatus Woesearchaeota archaeon]